MLKRILKALLFDIKADAEKFKSYIKRAEQHYREYLTVKFSLKIIDRLCHLLRATKRDQEAASITRGAVNRAPNYYTGWYNLGVFEMSQGMYATARVFFREALRAKPDYKEAEVMFRQVDGIISGRIKPNARVPEKTGSDCDASK